jgi:flagellar biosynthesis protein FlhB
MSDAGEKSFAPTPTRIAKARREGNVARAGELGANVALLAGLIALCAVLPALCAAMKSALIASSVSRLGGAEIPQILAYALVPAACAATAGALAGIVQAGGLCFIAPSLKLERLNPAAGFRRMLSRETFAHLVRALLAFACALAVVLPAVEGIVALALHGGVVTTLAQATSAAGFRLCFATCAIGLAFALFEYAAARAAWLRKLRVSFAEFKREMKEQDGDPAHRSRRRAFHRSIARGDLRRVKDAAFVLCNPTHVAIALAYEPPDEPVPRVLVRAADEVALRVRELAAQEHIPVLERVDLARALYTDAQIGERIPHAHYVAVAEIVATLIKSGAIAA